MIVVRPYFVFSAVSPVAALLLTATMAIAQDTDAETREKNCEVIKVKRGENAELVPEELRSPERARKFPFLTNNEDLLEEFRVEEDRRRDCLAGFGIFPGQAAATGVSGGMAPAGVAAAGAGLPAGLGTIGVVGAAIGIGVVGATVGIVGAALSGDSSNSAVCTTCKP